MSRAFDLINGDKIDLNNEVHRQIVINRNKTLEKALKEDLETDKLSVTLNIYLDCVKCGNTLNTTKYDLDPESLFDGNVADELPRIKCAECGTSYSIYENEFNGIQISVHQRKAEKAKRK